MPMASSMDDDHHALSLINNIYRVDHLHSLVKQDLRDLGVKLPKSKKIKKLLNSSRNGLQNEVSRNCLFGESLSHVPCVFIPRYGYVPQFLVDASKVIDANLESEGLFRKSGSLSRQKEMKTNLDDGQSLDQTSNPYDVAALIKQFFRELPEAVFMSCYLDAFAKCYQLSPEKDPKKAILSLCLLLPIENIGALRFTLHMLSRVASQCEQNKMTANNLAVVMAPNFMHSKTAQIQKMNSAEEKILHTKTCIVELLIRNWDMVGIVGTEQREQLKLMSECFGTDDELDASDDNTLEDSKDLRVKKRRKRSGSLTGLVTSIAQGIAKLRRSTDGRNVNTSSTSTFHGELSIASNTSVAKDSVFEDPHNATTPCVMRKRRASGETVPFSANKKKAILGNLPQKSALASTPFTPASTVKRPQYQTDHHGNTVQTPRLNATTTGAETKASRKKLNLFNTPGSNKKVKRQNSESWMVSPRQKKGKSIFRRLSGSRQEKDSADQQSLSSNESPHRPVIKSTLQDDTHIPHSVSSPNLNDQTCDQTMDYEEDSSDVPLRKHRGRSADSLDDQLRLANRSKSVDSPGLRRGQPNSLFNGLHKSGGKKRALTKIEIGDPCPIIVPVVPDAIDVKIDGELRRSRRDEFEEEKKLRECSRVLDLDKSVASHLDASLMEAILPPPQGFEDHSIVGRERIIVRSHGEEDEEIDVESDGESEAGFSTISGGTVMRRTDSGRYSTMDGQCSSRSSLLSSVSNDSLRKTAPLGLQPSLSVDSLLSVESKLSQHSVVQSQALSCSTDSGKGSILGDIQESPLPEDMYVSLNKNEIPEGEYVVLRREHKPNIVKEETDITRASMDCSKGMKLLCENYGSEEDSSSSVKPDKGRTVHNETLGSVGEDLNAMPIEPDVNKKKSLSSQDLQSAPKFNLPSRSHSLYVSPCKKFNYKPHIEVTRETHNLLARAGYVHPTDGQTRSKDVQFPVRSPKRSAYREEMMMSLRSSFHERHSRLSSSMRSMRRLPHESSSDSSLLTSRDTSISSQCDKLSLGSHESRDLFITEPSDIGQRVSHYSAKIGTLKSGSKESDSSGSNEGECKDSFDKPEPMDECVRDEESVSPTESKDELDVTNGESDDKEEVKEEVHSESEESIMKVPHRPVLKANKLKDNDKSLTLSGFLDAQHPLQIKRAQITLPKHNSIVNIKSHRAGHVAENVKQFTQKQIYTMPSVNKRGTSPIRIPTIFAKSGEKARHYREIATFMRERTGTKEFLQWPQVPPTPGKDSPDNCAGEESDASMSDGNVTVVEAMADNSIAQDQTLDMSTDQCPSPSTRLPVLQGPVELSDSLVNTINDVCTPETEKLLGGGLKEKDLIKSPLQESTNTAPTQSPRLGQNTTAGQTPRRMILQNTSSRPGSVARHHRPQIKRLRNNASPRRRHARSPKGRHHSPGSKAGVLSVPVHVDEGSQH